jgi:hypothetical protein
MTLKTWPLEKTSAVFALIRRSSTSVAMALGFLPHSKDDCFSRAEQTDSITHIACPAYILAVNRAMVLFRLPKKGV